MSASLIFKLQAEDNLTPALKASLNQINKLSAKLGLTSKEIKRLQSIKKGFLDGSIKSNIKSLDALKQKMLATTDTVLRKQYKADLIAAYNSELRRLNTLRQREQRILKNKISLANREYLQTQQQITQTQRLAQSKSNLINQMVRHIRQVESLVVAMYGLTVAYSKTLSVGFEYNKTIEAELMGLKLLVVQNLANYDSQKKLLTLKEKYNIAQKVSLQMMEQIKKINPETPYNLADTVKVYKALFPQLIRYKASMQDIAEITKKFTIIAKANNLEVDQFIRTVDTAFTGNMAQSQLKNVLERMGLDNEAVKQAIKAGNLLDLIKDKFKEVNIEMLGLKQTWANASSAFETNYQTIWGELQKPMFEQMIKGTQEINKYLSENKDEVINFIKTASSAFMSLAAILGGNFLGNLIKTTTKTGEVITLNKALILSFEKLSTYSILAGNAMAKGITKFRTELAIARVHTNSLPQAIALMSVKSVSSINLMTLATKGLTFAFNGLKTAIFAVGRFMMANPLGIAIAAWEAYSYWVDSAKRKQEEFNKTLQISRVEFAKMTTALQQNMITSFNSQIENSKNKLNELKRVLKGIQSNREGIAPKDIDDAVGHFGAFVKSNKELIPILLKQIELEKDNILKIEKKKNVLSETISKYKGVGDAISNEKTALIDINSKIEEINRQIETKKALNEEISPELSRQLLFLDNQKIYHENNLSLLENQVSQLQNGTNSANNLTNASWKTADAISAASGQAYNLALNIQSAANALQLALGEKMVAFGKMTQRQLTGMKLGIDYNSAQKEMEILGNAYAKLDPKSQDFEKKSQELRLKMQQAYVKAVKAETEAKKINDKWAKEDLELNRQITKQKELQHIATLKDKAKYSAEIKLIKQDIANASSDLSNMTKGSYEYNQQLLKIERLRTQLNNKLAISSNKIAKSGAKAHSLAAKRAKTAQRLHNTQTKVNASLEEQKSILKRIDDLKANWWNFDKDGVKTAKEKWELAKKQAEALKTNSNKLTVEKAVTKEYKARLAYLQAEHNKLREIYNIMRGGADKMFSGDIGGGISSIFSGLGNKLLEPLKNQFSSYLTKISSSILGSFGGLTGSWITLGIQAIGSLFSNKLSQTEIQAGKGRREFDNKYFENQKALWEKYSTLPIAKKQLERLQSLDTKFASVALALQNTNLTGGLDLSGRDMTSSQSNTLFGLFSESKTPLGSGIEIYQQSVNQMLKDIQAVGYQSYKVQSSSFFGLFTDESIDTETSTLSSSIKKWLQDITKQTFDSVADSLDVLGFDNTKFNEAIKKQVVELGKINFKDMKPEEQAKALKGAIGEMLGKATIGALKQFADPKNIKALYDFQTASESITDTISRLAVDFQGINVKLADFRHGLENFQLTEYLAKASGGLENFNNLINSFENNYYDDNERLAMQLKSVYRGFKDLNITIPHSKDEMRHLIETFKVTDEATAKTYAELLKLSDGFAQVIDKEKELRDERLKAIEDINKKWKDAFTDFWTGENSPLGLAQRAKFAEIINKNDNSVDSALMALNAKRESSVTIEGYRDAGFEYLKNIKKERDENLEVQKKLLDKTEKLLDEIQKQNNFIEKSNNEAVKSNGKLEEIETTLKETKRIQEKSLFAVKIGA